MKDFDIAIYLQTTKFRCACGDSEVWLDNLEMDDAIKWLKEKIPIYHMGLVGCCEKLRCKHCDEFPDECQCLKYEPYGDEEQ